MLELNSKDIWRWGNPTKKEYACHSVSHNTYSRIDYFLISSLIASRVNSCAYKSILISDHSLILLNYSAAAAFRGQPIWRLKLQGLQIPKFIEYVRTNIDDYFLFNTNETSTSIRWEAFKAFIRGQMMGYTRNKSNKHFTQMLELEREIKEHEVEININNSIEKQQKLAVLRAEYGKLSTDKASADVLRLKQTYYDQGERAGKLLAWCIKTLQNERTISEIANAKGDSKSNLQEILLVLLTVILSRIPCNH